MCKECIGKGACCDIICNGEKLEMSPLYTQGLGKSSFSLCWDALQLLKNGAGCSHMAGHRVAVSEKASEHVYPTGSSG